MVPSQRIFHIDFQIEFTGNSKISVFAFQFFSNNYINCNRKNKLVISGLGWTKSSCSSSTADSGSCCSCGCYRLHFLVYRYNVHDIVQSVN